MMVGLWSLICKMLGSVGKHVHDGGALEEAGVCYNDPTWKWEQLVADFQGVEALAFICRAAASICCGGDK